RGTGAYDRKTGGRGAGHGLPGGTGGSWTMRSRIVSGLVLVLACDSLLWVASSAAQQQPLRPSAATPVRRGYFSRVQTQALAPAPRRGANPGASPGRQRGRGGGGRPRAAAIGAPPGARPAPADAPGPPGEP